MKLALFITVLGLSLSAMAEKIEIVSTNGATHNVSQIERSINVDNSNGRINVVEIDNGGSTDIAGLVYPSELLVTYFKDGEMINLNATFDLGPIFSLKSAKMNGQKTIIIDVEIKDMQLKSLAKKITVNISDLIEKATNPKITVNDFETQTIEAKIISSEKLGE